MAIALYAGSFDPVTFGHMDIILRAAKIFDFLVVGVGCNPEKHPLFSAEDRVRLITENIPHNYDLRWGKPRRFLTH